MISFPVEHGARDIRRARRYGGVANRGKPRLDGQRPDDDCPKGEKRPMPPCNTSTWAASNRQCCPMEAARLGGDDGRWWGGASCNGTAQCQRGTINMGRFPGGSVGCRRFAQSPALAGIAETASFPSNLHRHGTGGGKRCGRRRWCSRWTRALGSRWRPTRWRHCGTRARASSPSDGAPG